MYRARYDTIGSGEGPRRSGNLNWPISGRDVVANALARTPSNLTVCSGAGALAHSFLMSYPPAFYLGDPSMYRDPMLLALAFLSAQLGALQFFAGRPSRPQRNAIVPRRRAPQHAPKSNTSTATLPENDSDIVRAAL